MQCIIQKRRNESTLGMKISEESRMDVDCFKHLRSVYCKGMVRFTGRYETQNQMLMDRWSKRNHQCVRRKFQLELRDSSNLNYYLIWFLLLNK